MADGVVDEDGTFIYMKIPSKKRHHPSKYAGINPNVVLKRRYMLASSEDKKRDLDCKRTFFIVKISFCFFSGVLLAILDSEHSVSRNQRYSMMKTHVLSDEISLLPPVCRRIRFINLIYFLF